MDYAFEFTNVPAYNGTITDSTAVNVDVFSDIYSALYMGRTVADEIAFPKLESVAKNWVNERLSRVAGNDTITLASLYYNYSRISPDAVREDKITIINGNSYADSYVNGEWQNPYKTLSTMVFTPAINSFNKRTFNITFCKCQRRYPAKHPNISK